MPGTTCHIRCSGDVMSIYFHVGTLYPMRFYSLEQDNVSSIKAKKNLCMDQTNCHMSVTCKLGLFYTPRTSMQILSHTHTCFLQFKLSKLVDISSISSIHLLKCRSRSPTPHMHILTTCQKAPPTPQSIGPFSFLSSSRSS